MGDPRNHIRESMDSPTPSPPDGSNSTIWHALGRVQERTEQNAQAIQEVRADVRGAANELGGLRTELHSLQTKVSDAFTNLLTEFHSLKSAVDTRTARDEYVFEYVRKADAREQASEERLHTTTVSRLRQRQDLRGRIVLLLGAIASISGVWFAKMPPEVDIPLLTVLSGMFLFFPALLDRLHTPIAQPPPKEQP